jgi:hypothetical protein
VKKPSALLQGTVVEVYPPEKSTLQGYLNEDYRNTGLKTGQEVLAVLDAPGQII